MNQDKIFAAVNNMIQTDRMHKHLLDSNVSKIGLHRTGHRVLMHIAINKKLFSQKSLAEHIGITPAAITGVLKKLEKDGYIIKEQGDDNRYNEIKLTELGHKVVLESRALFSRLDMSLFEGFSESELDGYIHYLEKIQANIKKNAELTAEEGTNSETVV